MKTKMNIVVRGLFATPVAALEVPNPAERNSALVATIQRKRNEAPSVQASNAGDWHSDREILTWGGKPVVEILEFAKEIANRLTADRQGKPSLQAWKVMAWANVNGPGDANICH
jgi:hypothetical protein